MDLSGWFSDSNGWEWIWAVGFGIWTFGNGFERLVFGLERLGMDLSGWFSDSNAWEWIWAVGFRIWTVGNGIERLVFEFERLVFGFERLGMDWSGWFWILSSWKWICAVGCRFWAVGNGFERLVGFWAVGNGFVRLVFDFERLGMDLNVWFSISERLGTELSDWFSDLSGWRRFWVVGIFHKLQASRVDWRSDRNAASGRPLDPWRYQLTFWFFEKINRFSSLDLAAKETEFVVSRRQQFSSRTHFSTIKLIDYESQYIDQFNKFSYIILALFFLCPTLFARCPVVEQEIPQAKPNTLKGFWKEWFPSTETSGANFWSKDRSTNVRLTPFLSSECWKVQISIFQKTLISERLSFKTNF